jgi:hypothetical protein
MLLGAAEERACKHNMRTNPELAVAARCLAAAWQLCYPPTGSHLAGSLTCTRLPTLCNPKGTVVTPC